MINYKQLLITAIPISLLLFFGIAACEEKTPPENYAARVNDVYLTESDIEEKLEEGLKFREEFVIEWIEDELLAQEAVKSGIVKGEKYAQIIENSKRELAAALLLSEHFSGINPELKQKTLYDYYDLNRDDFKLPQDAFVINKAGFSEEETAIRFRNYLVENNWKKAFEKFSSGDDSVNLVANKLFYPFQIQPVKLYRILNEMMPGEVSIIVEAEPKKFEIVQLIRKYSKEEIPDFEYVSEVVKERFLTYQKKLIYKEYIDKLYSENQVEVNK